MLQIQDVQSVREVTLARPPANALNPALLEALDKALSDAVGAGMRAVVIAGAPGMFSAGLDVAELMQLDRAGMGHLWSVFFGLMRRITESPIPIVAAITGHSPAGGAVMSSYCDHRIMAEGDFRIGLNEVHVGLPVPPVIFGALEHVVGRPHAVRLATTGRMMRPDEALRFGFVDEVVPMAQVVPRARALCEELLRIPPRAYAETRKLARQPLFELFEKLDDAQIGSFADAWFTDETQGALTRLLEKIGKRSRAAQG